MGHDGTIVLTNGTVMDIDDMTETIDNELVVVSGTIHVRKSKRCKQGVYLGICKLTIARESVVSLTDGKFDEEIDCLAEADAKNNGGNIA